MRVLPFVLLLVAFQAFSQEPNKNSFGITAGIGQADKFMPTIGGGSLSGSTFELGINYYRQLTRKIKLESGFFWHLTKSSTTSDGPVYTSNHYNVGLIYIPIMMRLNFSNHFYMNTGLLADIDLRTEPDIQNQTGLGASLGFGYETKISGKLILQINPYFNMHSLWVVTDNTHCDCYPSGILERGVKIGIRTR